MLTVALVVDPAIRSSQNGFAALERLLRSVGISLGLGQNTEDAAILSVTSGKQRTWTR